MLNTVEYNAIMIKNYNKVLYHEVGVCDENKINGRFNM